MKKILILSIFICSFFQISFANLENSCKISHFDNVNQIKYSQDWNNIIYTKKEWEKESMYINWKKEWVYDDIWEINYIWNWKTIIFLASKDKKVFLVTNWVEWEEFDEITNLNFSEKSDNVIYTGKQNWINYLVHNWIKINEQITNYLTMSPSGESYSYVNAENIVIKDWVKWESYSSSPDDAIIIDNLKYSKIWNKIAYMVHNRDSFVVLDGKKWKNYDTYSIDNLTLSPNWAEVSYTAEKMWKYYLIKNENEISWYNSYDSLIYSEDWKSFTFIGKKDGKNYVVTDWKESEWFEFISWLKYLKNWEVFFVWYKDTKHLLIQNGKEIWEVNSINKLYINNDWKNVSYIDTEKNWSYTFVHNWIKSEKYDDINNITYSQDWNNFAYISEKWNEKKVVYNWVEIWNYDTWKVWITNWVINFLPDWKSIYYYSIENNNGYLYIYDCSGNNYGKILASYTNIKNKEKEINETNNIKKDSLISNSNNSANYNSNYLYVFWLLILISIWVFIYKIKKNKKI